MKTDKKTEALDPVVHQTFENCQVFNGPISGCVFAMPGANVTQHTSEHETPASKQDVDIVAQLKPMFFGNEAETKNFLKCIQGMKPREITALVSKLVKERKLSDLSCHRDLYKVLNGCGIYSRTESNWNAQVR
jgi:hypothetical protein